MADSRGFILELGMSTASISRNVWERKLHFSPVLRQSMQSRVVFSHLTFFVMSLCILTHLFLCSVPSATLSQLYPLLCLATSIPSTAFLVPLFHTCSSSSTSLLTFLAVAHRAVCLVERMLQTLWPVAWWDLQVSKALEYTNVPSLCLPLPLTLWLCAGRHLMGIAMVIGPVCCQAENL